MTDYVSLYLIAIAVGWVVAQGMKYVISVIKTGRIDQVRQLYLSGNMPSAHTATVTSLLAVIALKDGINSAIFAVAALFAAIVMYDAVMVRRSSGEQGMAIQALIKEGKSKVAIPRSAKGHTPVEVLAGAVLGVVIGCIVFFATV